MTAGACCFAMQIEDPVRVNHHAGTLLAASYEELGSAC